MQIYKDRCPFCGTYISITEASICPGCNAQIYYGPTDNINDRWSYYWPDRFQRDQAAKARDDRWAAQKAFDESPAGIEHARKIQKSLENQAGREGMEFLGVVLIVVLIPLVWFFGGHEWERFRLFGVPVFILGIILIVQNHFD